MGRKQKAATEVLEYIVNKHQPLSLRDVRYFASSYVAFREVSKDDLYAMIRDSFNVDNDNKVTVR